MNLINNLNSKKNENNETQNSNNITQKSNQLSQEDLIEKQSQTIRKLNGQKQHLENIVAKTKNDCSEAIREANRRTEEVRDECSRETSQSYDYHSKIRRSLEEELQDHKEYCEQWHIMSKDAYDYDD